MNLSRTTLSTQRPQWQPSVALMLVMAVVTVSDCQAWTPLQQQHNHPQSWTGPSANRPPSLWQTQLLQQRPPSSSWLQLSAAASENSPEESNEENKASPLANAPPPTTFREAEVWGLKCMQEGDYEQALKAFQLGLSLPGSRSDVRRTKMVANSPVGGAVGGMDSQAVQALDEFELQAAYYNMACAHAQLEQLEESVQALKQSFENGFDNYATVRGDPDLDAIKKEKSFERLMELYEPKKGFNPFGFLGKS